LGTRFPTGTGVRRARSASKNSLSRRRDGSLVSDYEYELPADRIASYPAERRDESRLLVLPPEPAPMEHGLFRKVVDLLEPGDVLVVNESKVLPARLLGRKPTGAPAEVLLLRPGPDASDPYLWEALVRPGRKLKPGRTVEIADDLAVVIVDSAPGGGRLVRLITSSSVAEALQRHGHVPLPRATDCPVCVARAA